MIPEIGCFVLVLAFGLSILQAGVAGVAVFQPEMEWRALIKSFVYAQFIFLLLSYACLTYSFLVNDFSVVYVAQNSNTHLPWMYKIAAVWGAHEGSLLLWVTQLALWSAAVAFLSKNQDVDFYAAVLAVLGLLSAGFLLFLLSTSNPFNRYWPDFPFEGADLNPVLQDPGLASHPPLLYMGYVGFSVLFAFAVAALVIGRLDKAIVKWARPWAIAAWCFLTCGITLGSWWAYRVLGWGGWWFWDPVENSSLLPWLAGTALIHSLVVTEKREALKNWTLFLAICVFSLSLLGTFLVRSGVLNSVHAFAEDPARGKFLLIFLAAVLGITLLLYAIRAPRIMGKAYFSVLSRETFLLVNNLFLLMAMITILLGTLYPFILEVLGLGSIAIGPAYFNAVVVPLMIPLLIAMGIGPLCTWQKMSATKLIQHLVYPFCYVMVFIFFVAILMLWQIPFKVVVGISLASWVIFSTLQSLWNSFQSQKILSMRQAGMALAHTGIAVCVIGITLTTQYKIERDVRMSFGDKASIGNYSFQFMGLKDLKGPNYRGVTGMFRVTKYNHLITFLFPQKRIYRAQPSNPRLMSLADIDVGFFRDLYLVLGEPLSDHVWSVRIYYQPFVRFIWWGGVLMFCGGLCVLLPMFSCRKIL